MPRATIPYKDRVWDLGPLRKFMVFSADGHRVAVAHPDGTLSVFELRRDQSAPVLVRGDLHGMPDHFEGAGGVKLVLRDQGGVVFLPPPVRRLLRSRVDGTKDAHAAVLEEVVIEGGDE